MSRRTLENAVRKPILLLPAHRSHHQTLRLSFCHILVEVTILSRSWWWWFRWESWWQWGWSEYWYSKYVCSHHINFDRTQGWSLSSLVTNWLTHWRFGDLNDMTLVRSDANCLMMSQQLGRLGKSSRSSNHLPKGAERFYLNSSTMVATSNTYNTATDWSFETWGCDSSWEWFQLLSDVHSKPTKPSLPKQTFQTQLTTTKLLNQTFQTEPTKPNLPNQSYQTYWTKLQVELWIVDWDKTLIKAYS